jgi:hypothetical protein
MVEIPEKTDHFFMRMASSSTTDIVLPRAHRADVIVTKLSGDMASRSRLDTSIKFLCALLTSSGIAVKFLSDQCQFLHLSLDLR